MRSTSPRCGSRADCALGGTQNFDAVEQPFRHPQWRQSLGPVLSLNRGPELPVLTTESRSVRHNRIVKLSRHLSSRWALWAFAAALLLKSAMPFLASASAQLQGKALVEVCTAYGVELAPSTRDSHELPTDRAPGHGSEHCALTALSALATAEPPVVAPMPLAAGHVISLRAHPSSSAPDACAAWVARLKHGPPPLA